MIHDTAASLVPYLTPDELAQLGEWLAQLGPIPPLDPEAPESTPADVATERRRLNVIMAEWRTAGSHIAG